jgi:hypothetical protein
VILSFPVVGQGVPDVGSPERGEVVPVDTERHSSPVMDEGLRPQLPITHESAHGFGANTERLRTLPNREVVTHPTWSASQSGRQGSRQSTAYRGGMSLRPTAGGAANERPGRE